MFQHTFYTPKNTPLLIYKFTAMLRGNAAVSSSPMSNGAVRYGTNTNTQQHSGRRSFQMSGAPPVLPQHNNPRTQMQNRAKKRRFADKLLPEKVLNF